MALSQEGEKMNRFEKLLVSRGFDLAKLQNDTTVYKVTNLDQAAALIQKAVAEHRHIHVVADYDCDGVMSGCNLYLILSEMGADFTIRFPKKMSEGYGISEKIVDEIPNGSLVITIDNGIAAIEAIDLANSRDMEVIVLDHHQIRGDGLLPNAACIVDPHIYKEETEFEHYCGAGIGHMLAKELHLSEEVVNQTMVLAAIATIQDVVPLIDNNRNIVKHGLQMLNAKQVDLPGIYSLCGALKLIPTVDVKSCITEEDIAFQIGPCVNAAGRMLDDGACIAFEHLIHYDIYGEDGIRELVEWNKKRKEETVKQQNILDIAADAVLSKSPKTTCMVLYAPGLHEGIIGINAAKVVEKYNMPAIVLTDSEDGHLKGSARSVEGINMKEALDAVSEFVFKYGGHAGAAGLTVEKDKLPDFIKAINKFVPKASVNTNTWKYDMEISEREVSVAYSAIRQYAPYGEGFPAPVVRVNGYNLVKQYGEFYSYIGENGVRLHGANSEAISFTMKEKFKNLGTPLNLNIVGTLGYSRFTKKPQVMINDFQTMIKQQEAGFLL
jgi:single-stranded-DNA-specific exonuclease